MRPSSRAAAALIFSMSDSPFVDRERVENDRDRVVTPHVAVAQL
jgi:hypothetical protein